MYCYKHLSTKNKHVFCSGKAGATGPDSEGLFCDGAASWDVCIIHFSILLS